MLASLADHYAVKPGHPGLGPAAPRHLQQKEPLQHLLPPRVWTSAPAGGDYFYMEGAHPPDQRLGNVLVTAHTTHRKRGNLSCSFPPNRTFQALMHLFLDPLKPYYSAGGARLHLGETGVTYGQAAIELEAFSRPLWALVPLLDGAAAPTRNLRTSTAGAWPPAPNPENPEYWGRLQRLRPVLCGDGRHRLRPAERARKAVGTPCPTPKSRTWPAGWIRSTTTRSPSATGSSS